MTPRKPLPDHASQAVEDAQADGARAIRRVDRVLARGAVPRDDALELALAARELERMLRSLAGIKRR